MKKEPFFKSPKTGLSKETDAIVPLITIDKKTGEYIFIGTAFYISRNGLILTAKHNIFESENKLFENLSVVHFMKDLKFIVRPIGKAFWDRKSDIAYLLPRLIKEDSTGKIVGNDTLILTDHVPEINEQLAIWAYPDSRITQISNRIKLDFNPEFYLGRCIEFHPNGFSLLKNSCYQTTIHIKSGASGGPVFDENGHVFAICSTGFDLPDNSEPISFVTPIAQSFSMKLTDGNGSEKTIKELIQMKVIELR